MLEQHTELKRQVEEVINLLEDGKVILANKTLVFALQEDGNRSAKLGVKSDGR
jgi:hypothetical protein